MDWLFLVGSTVLMVLGLLAHTFSKWAEYRQVQPVGYWTFLHDVAPAKSLLSVSLAIGIYLLYLMEGWLDPISAFLSGWASNSMADNVMDRFK